MEKRNIGRSALRVEPLCFGGNVFGWTADEAMSFRLLDAFVDAGLSFIDTADVYSVWVPGHTGGESETIIGRWLKKSGKRDRIVLATKVGAPMSAEKKGLKAAYIKAEVEDSLRRLQTDHIDLYQSHYDDAATSVEEPLRAYGELIAAGKVRVIGASNFTAARLTEALDASERDGLPRYECLQPHYNLVERPAYEAELEAVCRARGIGVIPYYSLASGFLSGKYRGEADLKKSVRGARAAGKYLDAKGHRVLAALDDVSSRHNAKPAQVALAWIMARPGLTAPIASATSVGQLEELIGAVKLSLSAKDIEQLNAASA